MAYNPKREWYFLTPPNWKDTLSVIRGWRTVVTDSKRRYEQRAALQSVVVRSLEYTIDNLSYHHAAYTHRKLSKHMHRLVGIPLWPDYATLTSNVLATDVELPVDLTTYKEFVVGQEVVLFEEDDLDNAEIAEVQSVTATKVTITQGLASGWNSGVRIYPVIPMKLKTSQDVGLRTSLYTRLSIDATETSEITTTTTTTSATSTTIAGAFFATDFSEYTDFQPPNDWTEQWYTGAAVIRAFPVFAGIGTKTLEMDHSQFNWYAASWDDVGEVTNVEVLAKVFSQSNVNETMYLVLRGSGVGAPGQLSGYVFNLSPPNDELEVYKYIASVKTVLDNPVKTVDTGTYYWIRAQISGTAVKAKAWDAAGAEPGGWDVEEVDASLASGWVGLGGYWSSNTYWDYFAVDTRPGSWPIPIPT